MKFHCIAFCVKENLNFNLKFSHVKQTKEISGDMIIDTCPQIWHRLACRFQRNRVLLTTTTTDAHAMAASHKGENYTCMRNMLARIMLARSLKILDNTFILHAKFEKNIDGYPRFYVCFKKSKNLFHVLFIVVILC